MVEGWLSGFGHAIALDANWKTRKKVGDVDVEEAGDVPQLRGGDTVLALFVLLDLLKGQPERATEIALVEAEAESAFDDASADVTIHGMGHGLKVGSGHERSGL